MDFFSHFLIGLFLSLIALKSFGIKIVIYAGIMAIIADFDVIMEPLKRIIKSNLLAHKGISHSFFYGFFVSALTGFIFSILTKEIFVVSWFIGFLFYSLHLVLDSLTASKIPLFYPFTKKRYRFFIDRAINPLLLLISINIIIFYSVIFFTLPKLFFSNLGNYFFAFYMFYLSYRSLTKILISLKLPKNFHYIPGILPFNYLIYENSIYDNLQSFKLVKKYQYKSNVRNLIESKIKMGSKEMDFYEQAKLMSKEYAFFSKWEAEIPIIQESSDFIIIVLILVESFAHDTIYSLKLTFDKISGRIIEKHDGFYKIPKLMKKS